MKQTISRLISMTKKFIILRTLITTTIFCAILSCSKNDSSKKEKFQNIISQKEYNPVLMSFIFQPSLKENTEIVIDFQNKKFIFRNIYEYIAEQPPSPSKNDKINNNITPNKPLKPFIADLNQEEINTLKKIINSLSNSDYKGIEDTYIDGTSYNFMISFGNNFKNGFIANKKTKNQQILISNILHILENKNKFEENENIINYYLHH